MLAPHHCRPTHDGPRIRDRGRRRSTRRRIRASVEPLEDRSLLSSAAVIDWSMAPRIVPDPAHGGVPDLPNTPSDVNPPDGYAVNLDASHSAGIQPSTAFAWTITSAGGFSQSLVGEDPSISLPQGTYTVQLTATNLDGATSPQVDTASINVKNVLIVAIGDSYASGEGNPVVASSTAPQWAYSPSPAMNAENANAHRSTISGPAEFAYQLQQANPHEAVTFVSVADSGASIPAGVLGPMPSIANPAIMLPAQIDELRQLIGTQHIDVLTVSLGANTVGISRLVEQVVSNTLTGSPTRGAIIARVNARLARLPAQFARLAAAIRPLDPTQVLITPYPDITRNQFGQFETVFGPTGLPLVSRADARLVSQQFIAPLDRRIAVAARRHGWTLVSGITADFRTHGYPSSSPWIQTLPQSLAMEGSPDGTFHPNALGEQDIASRLLDAYLGISSLPRPRRGRR
ncbi:MAG: hypothetical protein ACYC61_17320 [Isosphaeraceae bacterium]